MFAALLFCALQESTVLPVPVQAQWWEQRHQAVLDRVKLGKADVVFIGDSITHAFGGDPDTHQDFSNRGADTWNLYYGDRRAVNLGFSGDRTQHVLWRIDHGELDGIRPKAVVIMIGTNNSGSNSAVEIAAGIEAIVDRVHSKLPESNIVLLAVFPRGASDSVERAKLDAVNERIGKFGSKDHVRYVNINSVFLDKKGEISQEIMPDKLHPSALGYRLWAMAMEPVLAKAMHVKAKLLRDSTNSALVPVTQNRDYPLYDWMTRHKAVLDYNKSHSVGLVFVGDSITHRFGGPPTDGTPTTGKSVWDKSFAKWGAADLGFGYDRTENVLWRIEQGELDGIHPKGIVILIGTNNLVVNTIEQTGEGVLAVVDAVKSKQPKAKILLLGVLPRGQKPDDPMRLRAAELNHYLSSRLPKNIDYFDQWESLVNSDGSIAQTTMFDYLHPTEEGYSRIADLISPRIAKWFD